MCSCVRVQRYAMSKQPENKRVRPYPWEDPHGEQYVQEWPATPYGIRVANARYPAGGSVRTSARPTLNDLLNLFRLPRASV